MLSNGRRRNFWIRALYFTIGFCPIGSLCLALLGILPLHRTGFFVVLPAVFTALLLGIRFPAYGKLALKGLLCGMIATLFYDLTRFPFVAAGLWPDFIPKIGELLLNQTTAPWMIGYLWRYLGNGGGMGVAFVMLAPALEKHLPMGRAAVAYGVAIWGCLMLTLFACPHPEELMFKLTPTTFLMSLVGHLVYGGMLGMRWPTRFALEPFLKVDNPA